MKYEIDLQNIKNDIYDENSDNVATLEIFNNEGKDISKQANAILYLSKNALLGLGTELIRLAHSFEDGKHIHLDSLDEQMIVERLGVFMTPESSDFIICCSNMKDIDSYFMDDK